MSKKFWNALKQEKPLQVVGTINAYSALLAKEAGFKTVRFPKPIRPFVTTCLDVFVS